MAVVACATLIAALALRLQIPDPKDAPAPMTRARCWALADRAVEGIE